MIGETVPIPESRPDAVPTERMGMRGSILGRVRGVGGAAAVASSPTTGTEVRISWQQR